MGRRGISRCPASWGSAARGRRTGTRTTRPVQNGLLAALAVHFVPAPVGRPLGRLEFHRCRDAAPGARCRHVRVGKTA